MPTVVYFLLMIPLAGILYSAYVERLRFQEKLLELGGTDSERAAEYAELQETNARLARRVENLEAVVTSRLWHSTQSDANPSDRARLDIALSAIEPELPSERRRIERLAEGLVQGVRV